MTSIHNFLRDHAHINSIETVFEEVDPQIIYGTRPFLTNDRLAGKRRRASKKYPQLIETGQAYYCIDGHHKVRRAIENASPTILCEVAHSSSELLEEVLINICSDLIRDLVIK